MTSPAVRRLLESPLDSFEKLEIVVALHRTAARTSSNAELASAIALPLEIVSRAVDELVRAGFVENAGGLTRLTASPADRAAVGELVELYDEDRILVVRALSQIAMDKIRGMAARTFADAFKLRKKREDDDG